MKNSDASLKFRLSTGGLFYRLMVSLSLTSPERYHLWRRIVLFAGLTWLPLLVLTAIDNTLIGGGVEITFLHDPVPHTRYLIALPLLVLAEWVIDPYMAPVLLSLQNTGLVTDQEKTRYRKAVDRLVKLRDAPWVDPVLYGLALGLTWILKTESGFPTISQEPSSWMSGTRGGAEIITPAGWWFLVVNIPFIQFILYRWIWRILIWIGFLNRTSRLRLALQPSHPDGVGGLGILSGAQSSHGIIFMAVGAMMSSSLAREIIHTGRTLTDVKWEVAGFVLVCVVIVIGPLCTFFSPLLRAKRQSLRHYSKLAYQLSKAFSARWIQDPGAKPEKDLITAADPSAVADFSVVFETISGMRLIPLKKATVLFLLVMQVLPFLPLVLTQVSLTEALQRLAQTIA